MISLSRLRSRLLADVGEDAAVDIQNVAVDEVGCIGSEEHCRTHEVVSGAPAGCRSLCNDELIEGMTAAVGLALAQRSGLRSGKDRKSVV